MAKLFALVDFTYHLGRFAMHYDPKLLGKMPHRANSWSQVEIPMALRALSSTDVENEATHRSAQGADVPHFARNTSVRK